MLKLVLVLAILVAPRTISGLSCYSCSYGNYDGEKSKGACYDNTTAKATCANETDSYCLTKFTFRDGIPTSVDRRCARGLTDDDDSTKSMPLSNKCTTSITTSSSTVDTTECYYHCKSDNCNDVSVGTVKKCDSDCSRRTPTWLGDPSQGFCNYISGECECTSSYEGKNCSSRRNTTSTPPIPRKCVQCNSATDNGCRLKTEGADCPSGQIYCSSVMTSIFTNDKVERQVLIRGCTNSHVAVDQCKFTDIYSDNGITGSGYKEYTCYSTCDTDSCNTNTPNGKIDGNETPRRYCYHCSSTSGYCTGSNKACDEGYDYCTSKMTYLVSDIQDRKTVQNPTYQMQMLTRSCGKAPLSNKCTETKIGDLGFKKVECEESCQEDGCNLGWPNRPNCLRCSGSGESSCFKNPGGAGICNYPYEKYCYIKDDGLEKGTKNPIEGYPSSIVRGCSYMDIPNGCTTTTLRDKSIQTCNYTCSTDGCNVGSGSFTVHARPNFALGFYIVGLLWISAKVLWY